MNSFQKHVIVELNCFPCFSPQKEAEIFLIHTDPIAYDSNLTDD